MTDATCDQLEIVTYVLFDSFKQKVFRFKIIILQCVHPLSSWLLQCQGQGSRVQIASPGVQSVEIKDTNFKQVHFKSPLSRRPKQKDQLGKRVGQAVNA